MNNFFENYNYYLILILLLPKLAFCQIECDTVYTIKGDVILINHDHIQYKKTIKYSNCGENKKENSIRIDNNEITRIGINKLKIDLLKQSKKGVGIRIKDFNNKKIKGKLIGIRDTSVIMYATIPSNGNSKKSENLVEYSVSNIDKIAIFRKKQTALGLGLGIIIGSGIGVSNTDYGGFYGQYYWANGILGGLFGGLFGALVSQINLKVNINGNQERFNKKFKNRHFFYK